MDVVFIIIGIILLIIGIAGCFLPIIPGPPVSYIALLLLHFTGLANNGDGYSLQVLVLLGVLSIGIIILDMFIPVYGAKKTGSSRAGMIGSGIGIIVGLFLAGATGGLSIIFGPFVGAIAGEMLSGKDSNQAVKAGIGTFLGFLAGTFAKLVVSIIITIFFISGLV